MKVLQIALVMAMTLCVAGNALAASNSVPYMESFEVGGTYGYTAGQSIISDPNAGWYASDPLNGTIVAQAKDYLGSVPIPTADHDQVLEFSDAITNLVDTGSSPKVWVDCLINPTLYDTGMPTIDTNNVKIAMFVNSNGYIVTYGTYYDTNTTLYVSEWLTLDNPPIGTNQWVRLTIEMDFQGQYGQYQYYQISLDSQPPLTHAKAMLSPDSYTYGGSWFISPETSRQKMESFSMSGTGQLDDLQVVTNTPLNTQNYTITASVDNASAAFIQPFGNVTVTESNDVPFTITELTGYTVTNVYVSYSGFEGWIGAVASYTMTNVVSDGYIMVYTEGSAPSETSAGTPYSYYDDLAGLNTTGWDATDYQNEDDADNDSDGMLGWQEYRTGTDASDSNSYFRVIDITYAGDSNKVSFFGSTAYGAPSMWSMYRSVNLTNDWDLINTNGIPVSDGTNNWWDLDAPGTAPVFYQPSSHIE